MNTHLYGDDGCDADYDSDDDEIFDEENFVQNMNTIMKAPDTNRMPILTSPANFNEQSFPPERYFFIDIYQLVAF